MDVTVVVGTFGDETWADLARERAIPSAAAQAGVVHVHGDTLAQARNAALEQVETSWVIHLDADDELEPGYVHAMDAGAADIRAPAVRYVTGSRARAPYVPRVAHHTHACFADCLAEGNFIIVGATVRTELVRNAGGWLEEPCYEDWSLWLRMWRRGASVEVLPQAVYRAHVRPDSRNRGRSIEEKNRVHREIVEAHG